MMYLAGWVCRSCVTGRPDKFIPAACFLSAVAGESERDKSLRALRVMALVREDGREELWLQVSHYFMQNGQLDLSGVMTASNLPDLVFLLSSPQAAEHITWLK